VSADQNLQLMRRTLNAFLTGDGATLAQVFSEDVVWRVPGRSAMSGEFKGQAEVFGFFGSLMEKTAGTFHVESLDMFANESGGVYVDRLTATRDARSLDVKLTLHVLIRDGRIVDGTDYIHPEHAWDAFWV